MYHDIAVRQSHSLSLCAAGQQKCCHGRCHANADGGNVAFDILNGVVDGHTGSDGASGTCLLYTSLIVYLSDEVVVAGEKTEDGGTAYTIGVALKENKKVYIHKQGGYERLQ